MVSSLSLTVCQMIHLSWKQKTRVGRNRLFLGIMVHTLGDAWIDVLKLLIDHLDKSSVQLFGLCRDELWEQFSGGGWSEKSCAPEQAWRESNLQLPHLFPPFHSTSIETDFIQILLHLTFGVCDPLPFSCGDF